MLIYHLNRFRNALFHFLNRRKKSFSQTGEDLMIENALRGIKTGFYIDIGANHPTKLSNTYKFYRSGWKGICVEPNREYEWLHRLFRPRDTFIGIGIGPQPCLLKFYRQAAAVLGGFCEQSEHNSIGIDFLPVLPLNALLPLVPDSGVDLLTIDVEGMNLEVRQSGEQILEIARMVVVEGGDQELAIRDLMVRAGFSFLNQTRHNLLFKK